MTLTAGTNRTHHDTGAHSTPVRIDRTAVQVTGFREDVLTGLRRPQKAISSKYFYDRRGSELFDQICELDEYYLTRVELSIMRDHADEMAAELGPDCCLIEFGSGSSLKTRVLLSHMIQPAAYVPVDISLEHLTSAAARLREEFPHLPVRPVCADFTQPIALPAEASDARGRSLFFPGSTIGNFDPPAAGRLLAAMAETCRPAGGVLIGVDLCKDRDTLERAYNDAKGVTAQFNINLLRRVNRELGADFDLTMWRHRAVYHPIERRIETHLVSSAAQTVRIGDATFQFAEDETIHTENSYKYELEQFAEFAQSAGLSTRRVWTDPGRLFSVHYLHVD